MDNDRVEVDVAFPADAFCFVKNWRDSMDKPWLLTRETFNDMRGDETALLYTSIQRILRAQHLKTLEWVNQHMFSLIQDGTTLGMQKWESLLAQARKDVEE